MLIFFTIALIGFLYVLFTSVIGHAADAVHDIGHGGADGHDGDSEHMTSIFSPRIIAIFLMGFGASGGVARFYGYSYPLSCLIGFGVGIAMGFVMFWLMEFLVRQQCNSLVKTSDLVGQTGTVDVPIEGDDPGQVTVQYGGRSGVYTARSKGGKNIGKGKQVTVLATAGSNLTVEEVTI
jgi:membrane protein implicated in regulation of membrane protease activity